MMYSNIDTYGIKIGFFAFLSFFFISYYLLKKYDLKQRSIVLLCLISALGHILGALFLCWYTLNVGSDALVYFNNATQKFNGLGYAFACFILGYQKAYILGDSFLGAFLFSGAVGFLGSIFYLLTFKILIDKIPILPSDRAKDIFYPALLLLCWPSYFFWSAGPGKDNFIFFFLATFLFALANGRKTLLNICLFMTSGLFIFLIRPYLFAILVLTTTIYSLFAKNMNIKLKGGIFIGIALLIILLLPQIREYVQIMTAFNGTKINSIGNYIIYTQASMQEAIASIPMPTYNPRLVFLFLPYFILINLFLPLGLGAYNLASWLCSVENAFFLGWVIFFIKNRALFKVLQQKIAILNFFLIYFSVGIACLSIMNLNLGLAMREKMMYVPALLIVIFVVYFYKTKSLKNLEVV